MVPQSPAVYLKPRLYIVITVWSLGSLSISATDVATLSSKCAHAVSAQIPQEHFVVNGPLKILLAQLVSDFSQFNRRFVHPGHCV